MKLEARTRLRAANGDDYVKGPVTMTWNDGRTSTFKNENAYNKALFSRTGELYKMQVFKSHVRVGKYSTASGDKVLAVAPIYTGYFGIWSNKVPQVDPNDPEAVKSFQGYAKYVMNNQNRVIALAKQLGHPLTADLEKSAREVVKALNAIHPVN